jgi:hypothetical protein
LIQRQGQTQAFSFDERLFACPAIKKSHSPFAFRQCVQRSNFTFREETPGDIFASQLRLDLFQINSDFSKVRKSKNSQTAGMGEVEF